MLEQKHLSNADLNAIVYPIRQHIIHNSIENTIFQESITPSLLDQAKTRRFLP